MLIYLAQYLLDNYNVLREITSLVNTTDIWLMPSMNPDGYNRSKVRITFKIYTAAHVGHFFFHGCIITPMSVFDYCPKYGSLCVRVMLLQNYLPNQHDILSIWIENMFDMNSTIRWLASLLKPNQMQIRIKNFFQRVLSL